MDDKFLRFVYAFFLGLIIALFVGMGISTFYPAPEMPEYPPHSITPADMSGNGTTKVPEEDLQVQREYEEAYKRYDEASQTYHRNVSIISLVSAVIFVILSSLLARKNHVIMNGVMLGGVFVLIYSIGRGIASTDTKYTFIAVSISLLVILYLGYRRFGNGSSASVKKSVQKAKK